MNSMQGYAEEIVKGLKAKNYEVTHLDNACRVDKKKLSLIEKIIKSLAKDLKIRYFLEKYKNIEIKKFKKMIEELGNDFDYLVDFAAGSNPVFMDLFIKSNPKTHKVLFIWDDLEYHAESKELLMYFDKIFTYNKYDSVKYNLNYRPSFYLDIFNYSNEKKDIDIFYVATMREKKRAEFARLIDNISNKDKNYIKLIHKLKIKDYLFNRVFLKYIEYFSVETLNVYKLAEYYKKSKVLLDISFTGQVGLGLRPIEALASKCKLITTNKDIEKYDFYNKNNILIIENGNITEIQNFLDKPYEEIGLKIIEQYSIGNFLEEIMKK